MISRRGFQNNPGIVGLTAEIMRGVIIFMSRRRIDGFRIYLGETNLNLDRIANFLNSPAAQVLRYEFMYEIKLYDLGN